MSSARRLWTWVGLAVALGALAIDLLHRTGAIGIDFHTYLAAARVGLQHGWTHIYDQGLVAAEQKRLTTSVWSQAFLSPPTVAWVVTPLSPLAYGTAYVVWSVGVLLAFALSLVWSSSAHGVDRWLAVAGALSPWWVMHAINLGQVVPLVAAGVVVASRLVRDDRDVAAGIALSVIWFKPNTAILVPLVLIVAGRHRAFTAWLLASAVIAVAAALTVGPGGMSAYAGQLLGPQPNGADFVTLHGAFGVTGWLLAAIRALIVVAIFVAAYRLRRNVNLVVPIGAVGSLIVSPYLHASDLCVLVAAAWIVWESHPSARWRVPIAIGWIFASPFIFLSPVGAQLSRWPLIELALLAAMVGAAWQTFTGRADLRTRAPA